MKTYVQGTTIIGVMLFSSAVAMAAGLSNLNIPAPGTQIKPHLAQPILQPKPSITPSLGHTAQPKKSSQKKKYSPLKVHRQKAKRYVPPHVPAIRHQVQKSPVIGRHPLPSALKPSGIRSIKPLPTHRPVQSGNRNNTAIKKSAGGFSPRQGKSPVLRDSRPIGSGFAPSSPSTTSGTTPGSSSPGASQPRGGFAPAGIAGQVHVSNALSPQQLSRISGATASWGRYQRAMEEQRRRDEAEAQARADRLSREAMRYVDCDDRDPEIHPGLLEVCDHKDNNCDGHVDEGTTILSYLDADGDGHGDPAHSQEVCSSDIRAAQSRGEWISTLGNDCNDADPDRWHDCP